MNSVAKALGELPFDLASKKEWERRGFRLRTKARKTRTVSVWNGMYYNNINIYPLTETVEIRGKKAKERRSKWYEKIGELLLGTDL